MQPVELVAQHNAADLLVARKHRAEQRRINGGVFVPHPHNALPGKNAGAVLFRKGPAGPLFFFVRPRLRVPVFVHRFFRRSARLCLVRPIPGFLLLLGQQHLHQLPLGSFFRARGSGRFLRGFFRLPPGGGLLFGLFLAAQLGHHRRQQVVLRRFFRKRRLFFPHRRFFRLGGRGHRLLLRLFWLLRRQFFQRLRGLLRPSLPKAHQALQQLCTLFRRGRGLGRARGRGRSLPLLLALLGRGLGLRLGRFVGVALLLLRAYRHFRLISGAEPHPRFIRESRNDLLVVVQLPVQLVLRVNAHLFVVAVEELGHKAIQRHGLGLAGALVLPALLNVLKHPLGKLADVPDLLHFHRNKLDRAAVQGHGGGLHGAAHLLIAVLAAQRRCTHIKHHHAAVNVLHRFQRVVFPGAFGFVQIFFVQPDVEPALLKFQHVPPDQVTVRAAVTDKNKRPFNITGCDLPKHTVCTQFFHANFPLCRLLRSFLIPKQFFILKSKFFVSLTNLLYETFCAFTRSTPYRRAYSRPY